MSAPRYRIPAKVIALLHERGETVESIARKAGSRRSHVTQVMANKPGRGHQTRRKLTVHLTTEELALLGWSLGGVPLAPGPNERPGAAGSMGNVPCSPDAEPEPLTEFPDVNQPAAPGQ